MLITKLNDCLYNSNHDDINHMIAKYIKQNIDIMGDMTIDELASACYVSKAKISKFCKNLGYDNYIALKDDCIKQVKIKEMVIENKKQNISVDYKKHLHHSIKTIENNLSCIDLSKLDELVKDIDKAQYIYLYGIDYGNLLCKYIQYESDILSKDMIVMDERLTKEYILDPTSIIIVISVEGKDLEDNLRVMRKLSQYHNKKWIISTDNMNKNLLNYFDYTFLVPSIDTEPKDRLVIIRYVIDVIMGRYQYLYFDR